MKTVWHRWQYLVLLGIMVLSAFYVSTVMGISTYDECLKSRWLVSEVTSLKCVTTFGKIIERFSAWQNYTNDLAKYTLKYPESWKYRPDKREIWENIIVGDGSDRNSLTSAVTVTVNHSLDYYIPWSGRKEVKITELNLGLMALDDNKKSNYVVSGKPAYLKKTNEPNRTVTDLYVLDDTRIIVLSIQTPADIEVLHAEIVDSFALLTE